MFSTGGHPLMHEIELNELGTQFIRYYDRYRLYLHGGKYDNISCLCVVTFYWWCSTVRSSSSILVWIDCEYYCLWVSRREGTRARAPARERECTYVERTVTQSIILSRILQSKEEAAHVPNRCMYVCMYSDRRACAHFVVVLLLCPFFVEINMIRTNYSSRFKYDE